MSFFPKFLEHLTERSYDKGCSASERLTELNLEGERESAKSGILISEHIAATSPAIIRKVWRPVSITEHKRVAIILRVSLY
jgi:hypothetical protein